MADDLDATPADDTGDGLDAETFGTMTVWEEGPED
jgi:hypothetical protein